MSAPTIIITLLDQVDKVTQAFTFNGYTALVSHCKTQINLAIVIYIAMLGWSVMNSWVEMSVNHFTKHVLKIAITLSLATHWDFFSIFVYDVLTNGPNELSSILSQSMSNTSLWGNTSVNEALQSVFDQGMRMGVVTWSNGGINATSFYLYALLIWIATFLVVGIALLEFIVAKFGLALLLVLAPLFCLLLLWENTKNIFETWLKFVLGFALIPIFVTASLMLLLALLHSALESMQAAVSSTNYTLVEIAPFLLDAIVGVGLLLKSAGLASSISGGLSINVMNFARSAASSIANNPGMRIAKQLAGQANSRGKTILKAGVSHVRNRYQR